MLKKRIIQAFWILAATGTIVLLVAAMQKKSARTCKDIEVEITGATEHVFVDEKDVLSLLKSVGSFQGVETNNVDLRQAEELLEQDPWILNAELFFDNLQTLQVRITEREPVARIFTQSGDSWYVDTSAKKLPLSDKLSARVPVFTNFPVSRSSAKRDTALLDDIITLGTYIKANSFWNAQVAQIDIRGKEFDIVPVIGNHVVRFGDINGMDRKFKKLFTFYKDVSTRVGFDKYKTIDLVYEGQIVAVKRGAEVPVFDSTQVLSHFDNVLISQVR